MTKVGQALCVTINTFCGTIELADGPSAILISAQGAPKGAHFLITDGAGRAIGTGHIVPASGGAPETIELRFADCVFAACAPGATIHFASGPRGRHWSIFSGESQALAA